MSQKVIYISWVKLTDRYARDYFLDHLIENGVEVEVWDVIAFTRERHNEIGELGAEFVRVLQSHRDLEDLVKLNKNIDASYVMLISLHWRTRSVFRILSKNGCKVVGLSWGALPTSSAPLWRRVATKLLAEPLSLLGSIFDISRIAGYKKLGLIKPYDVVFTAGSVLSECDQFSKKTIKNENCSLTLLLLIHK